MSLMPFLGLSQKRGFNRDIAFKLVARQARCKLVKRAQKFLSEAYPGRYVELKNLRVRCNSAADWLSQ